LPVEVSDELLATIKAQLPELPLEKKVRFIKKLGLSDHRQYA
jgi:Asp-tRNA(Asn)/Glu-tRNA(Gln) amidotransferase B subunit